MLRRTEPLAGLAAVLIALAACAGRPEPGAPADGAATSGAVATATLQFIEDDGPLALAEAKRRNVPVFVEAWAPW